MFIYINNLGLSTLIIYATKTIPIFQHLVKKSGQGEGADFEINCVILRQSQIIVWTPLTNKKYRLYNGVV